MLNLYNSLSNKTEAFLPHDSTKVKIYVCGPTVYDYIHIGNARAAVVYDILYRILCGIYEQDKVIYVRNLTDVDDKINQRAKEQNITIGELTSSMIQNFNADVAYLGCLKPTIEPKATEHISDMIKIIEKLIDEKYAYVTKEKNVYFSVEKFTDYGQLANKNLDHLLDSVRIENLQDKIQSHDFALWKAKEDEDLESSLFDSPWGQGRPGWHIECVAMSNKHLGSNFDIHGGGIDLIFPHHTNEIAQAKCAFKDSQFAKYWVHNGTLTVNKQKMSKSLGNFITVKEMRDKGISGEVVRYFLISANYHKPIDYSTKNIEDAKLSIDYLYRTLSFSVEKIQLEPSNNYYSTLPTEFREALEDNMNTPQALAFILKLAKEINKKHTSNKAIEKDLKLLKQCGNLLGLLTLSPEEYFYVENDEEVKKLIHKRLVAKEEKNWITADEIRIQLTKIGIVVEDKPDGSCVWRKL